MMKAIGLLALLAVLDVGAAIAQTGNKGSQSITGGIPEAPIGHRQPRATEVPDEKNWQNTNANDPLVKENRELERKIKNICRGC
jgi:hypothetical protein